MENIHKKKTNGHTWKSPSSAPCPGLFPTTLHFSILSFLLQFYPYSFPQKSQKNSFVLLVSPLKLNSALSPSQKKLIFSLRNTSLFLLFFPFSFLYLGFAFPTISTAATFLQPPFLSRLPAATFSVSLLLQFQKTRLIPYGH